MDPHLFLQIGGAIKIALMALTPLLALPLLVLIIPKPMKAAADAVIAIADSLSRFALAGAIAGAIIMLISELLVVVLRYTFSMSFTWLNEIAIYGFAAMFMLGAAATLRDDAHVRVDILRPRFGEVGRSWIELTGIYLFLFPICIRVLNLGETDLARAWLIFEGSRESDGLPAMFLFKTLLPVFAILLIGQGLSEALKAALRITGIRPADPHGDVHGA